MNREIQFYATLKTRWSKNRETRELVSICIKFIKEQRFYTRTGLNPYLARDIIKFSQNFRLIGIFLSLSLPLLRSDLESKLFGYIAKIQTKHREFHSIFPLKSNNSIILCCVNSSIPTIWLEKYCSFEFRFASRREGIQGIGITLTNWTLIDVLGGGGQKFIRMEQHPWKIDFVHSLRSHIRRVGKRNPLLWLITYLFSSFSLVCTRCTRVHARDVSRCVKYHRRTIII